MIWNDAWLLRHRTQLVTPFDSTLVNPASIDLRLGCEYRRWTRAVGVCGTAPLGATIHMASGEFLLCCSLEVVTIPIHACAALYSKSSTGQRESSIFTPVGLIPAFADS